MEQEMDKRVARLSIAEDEKEKLRIIQSLRESERPASNQAHPGSKRRRSSAAIPIRKKKLLQPPQFKVEEKTIVKKVGLGDIRDLVMYIFNDTNNAPSWVQIENRAAVKHVVVLFVPGMTMDDFSTLKDGYTELSDLDKVPAYVKPLADSFKYVWPGAAPGSKKSLYSSYQALTKIPLTKKEKEAKAKELENKTLVLPDLLMSLEDLLLNEYPIHPLTANLNADDVTECPEGWVDTIEFEHEGSKTFAMDCEMCMAESGQVLARVSLVDFEGNVIIDEYVKPEEEIVDYVTRFSGITPEILQDVTFTLADAQKLISDKVSAGDILIGHSLQSDLKVLKMRHPKVIDTSVIYEHKAGPPFKPGLKWLAETHLQREIQGSEDGHSSVEDSRTCMDLTKLKLIKGPSFGVSLAPVSIYIKLSQMKKKSMHLDYSQLAMNRIEHNVQCTTDDEIVDNIAEQIAGFDFVFARLKELEAAKGFCTKTESTPEVEDAMENLGKRLKRLYDSLPNSTALILCSGSGDTRALNAIYEKVKEEAADDKEKRQELLNQLDAELQEAVTKARDIVSFLTIKQDDFATAIETE